MEKAIFTIVEKCVACKGCEIACAVEHSATKTILGALTENPRPRPRVRVEKAGIHSYPSRCLHCEEAACVAACPMGAMTRYADTNAVYVDEHKCIGCWMCVMVCPFGGVSAAPETKTALKCDLCPDRTAKGEDPACVAACPTRAMIFATPEEMADFRRKDNVVRTIASASPHTPSMIDACRTQQGGVKK